MAAESFDTTDPESLKRMQAFFSPQHVDQQIRQAIQLCWMALPAEKKNIDEVEKQILRLVERALRDLKEDAANFGLGQ